MADTFCGWMSYACLPIPQHPNDVYGFVELAWDAPDAPDPPEPHDEHARKFSTVVAAAGFGKAICLTCGMRWEAPADAPNGGWHWLLELSPEDRRRPT